MSKSVEQEYETVLEFWFGPPPVEKREAWFTQDDGFDAEIRERFRDLHARAAAGGCDHWAETPSGALALIVVLDQFSRNLYRGDARAFASDPKALALAKTVIERGWDRSVPEVERIFFYLPFEHSEALADQHRAVALFAAYGEKAIAASEKHLWLIETFGRFPHRNAALGRENTPEEVHYLANGEKHDFEAG